MNATIVDQPISIRADAAVAPSAPQRLTDVQQRMLQRIVDEPSRTKALQGIADVVRECADPIATFFFSRDANGNLTAGQPLLAPSTDDRSARLAKQLRAASENACHSGVPCIRQQAAPERLILAVPVVGRGADPEAFAAIFPATDNAELLVMLMQMAASHLVLWNVFRECRQTESEAGSAAALLELLVKIENASDLQHAVYVLANELQTHLEVRRVAVGLREGGKGRCRLQAVSGVARFDGHSASAQAIEAAMDEALLHNDVSIWPSDEGESGGAALAHRGLCTQEDVSCAMSMPLRDHDSNAVAALVLLDDRPENLRERAQPVLRAAERPIATALAVMQRLEGGAAVRLGRAAGRWWRTGKGKALLGVALLAVLSMAIPVPHKVRCDCFIEPVTRRYVPAPFEGTLEESLVKPGDVVAEGEVLARMDGREVRWKRAGIVADRNQAKKRRDQSMAAHKSAEAQIARLEMDRLDVDLQLLDHRAKHLEIRSPMAGIVTGGDLERAEGAPLDIGQTLFEIAPLEKMVVEVAVADEDVSYVGEGLPVLIRLDTYPGRTWELELQRLQPRSEIREQQNVFIAEATLDNAEELLRPGMKGRASIVAPRRPLGWVLFHRPVEYLVKTLNW